ncbi:MAG: DNA/RNA non-specific endonuclease, partial [Prevotella sp.]|nr:DNA/RNA non-specific endonuclease [Prevotella sp.]
MKTMKKSVIDLLSIGLLVLVSVSCHNEKGVKDDFRGSERGDSSTNKLSSFISSPSGGGRVGAQYELPARLTDRPEQIIRRESFTISYNKDTRTPNYVAWHLTKAHTYGRFQRS